MKRLAVLTSGGDAPGMNACLRAVVRTALYHKIEVIGFKHGYEGLINDEHIHLDRKSVANIIQRGGTILKTSRSERFKTNEGLQKAAHNLSKPSSVLNRSLRKVFKIVPPRCIILATDLRSRCICSSLIKPS